MISVLRCAPDLLGNDMKYLHQCVGINRAPSVGAFVSDLREANCAFAPELTGRAVILPSSSSLDKAGRRRVLAVLDCRR